MAKVIAILIITILVACQSGGGQPASLTPTGEALEATVPATVAAAPPLPATATAAPASTHSAGPETAASFTALFQSVTRTVDVVYVRNEMAYLNVGPILTIVDVSEPRTPYPLGVVKLPVETIADIYVSEGYAYVAAYEAGLQIVDVSNPGRPLKVGAYVPPLKGDGYQEGAGAVVVDRTDDRMTAYVAAQEAGLRVVDVSEPAAPVEVGAFYTDLGVFDVALAREQLYLLGSRENNQTILILDILDPTRPQEISLPLPNLDYAGVVKSIAVSNDQTGGPYIYAAAGGCFYWGNDQNCGGMLRVIDVAHAAGSPIPLPGGDGRPGDIVVSHQHAYLAGGNGLWVVDVSEPARPRHKTILPSTGASDVAVAGDTLYVTVIQCTGRCPEGAGRDGGLQIFDLSNPAEPALVSLWQPTDKPDQNVIETQTEPTAAVEPTIEPVEE